MREYSLCKECRQCAWSFIRIKLNIPFPPFLFPHPKPFRCNATRGELKEKDASRLLNVFFSSFLCSLAGCRYSRDISGGLDIHGQGIHGSSSKEQPLHVSNVHYDRHRLCRHCTINSRMYRSFEGEPNTIREAILGHYPFVRKKTVHK